MRSALPTLEYMIALGGFVATLGLLALWLRIGLGGRLVALPNDRSSHHQPTPTGGGLVMVAVLTSVLLAFSIAGVGWAGWLAGGGLVIAAMGLADDVWELSARLRLLVQAIVVGVLLWSADAIPASQLGWPGLLPTPVVGLLWTLAIVWFINLFNFMDGIDGLAALQSGGYCLAALFFMLGDAGWYTSLLWAGVATSLGFAVFNVAPARIFMGDAGSAYWGLLLAILALQLANLGALPLVASLILLSAFWFDATYTLGVRILTSQRFAQAHRSHLYQRLADRFGHGRTTLGYLGFMVGWQWPLTYWSMSNYMPLSPAQSGYVPGRGLDLHLWWLVVLACLPLALGCVLLRAGLLPRTGGPANNPG